MNPARGTQMKALMDEEGLPYNAERNMTYNSRLAQELATWAETKGKGDEIHGSLFRAFFVDMKNIGKKEVLAAIAEKIGLPADEALKILQSRAFKEAVDADWKRSAALKIDGVPTFIAGRYMLVGAHPYGELEKLVQRAAQA